MKTSLPTFLFASLVLVACSGTSQSASISTGSSALATTSESSADGDIHTVVTRVSDNAQVATLEWSQASRVMTFQPSGGTSETLSADAKLGTPTLDEQNERASSLVNDAPSTPELGIEGANTKPVCQVVGAGTDGCMYCCSCGGRCRACTTCG